MILTPMQLKAHRLLNVHLLLYNNIKKGGLHIHLVDFPPHLHNQWQNGFDWGISCNWCKRFLIAHDLYFERILWPQIFPCTSWCSCQLHASLCRSISNQPLISLMISTPSPIHYYSWWIHTPPPWHQTTLVEKILPQMKKALTQWVMSWDPYTQCICLLTSSACAET